MDDAACRTNWRSAPWRSHTSKNTTGNLSRERSQVAEVTHRIQTAAPKGVLICSSALLIAEQQQLSAGGKTETSLTAHLYRDHRAWTAD
jgi:hypothetical protein